MATTKTIDLKTSIPGPRSQEILERKARVIAEPLSIYLPIVIAEARGATITDVDGNTFIDFAGGVGCLNVGHSNPRVVDAAREQLERFTHTDFTIVPYENYVGLAERLLQLVPIAGAKRAAFFNSGAEAIENSIKFARSFTKRPAVIAFDGGFHGRTLLALSLTSKTHPYKAGLGPFAPEVYRVPFNNLTELERAFKTRVAAEEVAAIVFEPVQGESGFIVAEREFVAGLRKICDDNGIVLVADEVQTGFGRTGRVFAMEHFDVESDLMAVAKSIAAGIPLSGVLGRAEIMDAPGDSAVGGTYVGNPVAIAAAHAVLDTIAEERLAERAEQVGETIRGRMENWRERFEAVADVRGLGAMLAIEIRRGGSPSAELATAVVEAAARRGLLILKAGIHGNCIRVLVPLVIGDAELDEALDVWEEALEEALA
ncbi:MAG TPA: 4-aminobutyrate--2-oxoglutarate transaminase [Gaiellaceae bacterium]|jgi:4-aminobutyrate aminotransferase/(S)-3-amino-2-methylpropionate transaminase|nr:4-aminobutyrate--2-oxoglutarate transaminase [Gaiellaceae bacterium]